MVGTNDGRETLPVAGGNGCAAHEDAGRDASHCGSPTAGVVGDKVNPLCVVDEDGVRVSPDLPSLTKNGRGAALSDDDDAVAAATLLPPQPMLAHCHRRGTSTLTAQTFSQVNQRSTM